MSCENSNPAASKLTRTECLLTKSRLFEKLLFVVGPIKSPYLDIQFLKELSFTIEAALSSFSDTDIST